MRICFVCMGNICRSPTAEGVMRRLVANAGLGERIAIDSAGTGGWHVGELPDERSRQAAARRGLSLDHRARQLGRADLESFDLLVVMDEDNLAHVEGMRRALAARGGEPAEVRLLRSFDPTAPAGAEVPDPYAGGPAGFEEVLDQCERACAGLLEHARRRVTPA